MKPEEVFLLMEYCYEDVRVVAVFYDEQRAKAAARQHNRECREGYLNHDYEVISMIVEDA